MTLCCSTLQSEITKRCTFRDHKVLLYTVVCTCTGWPTMYHCNFWSSLRFRIDLLYPCTEQDVLSCKSGNNWWHCMLSYERVPELQIKWSYHFEICRPDILLCYIRSFPESCKSVLMIFLPHLQDAASCKIEYLAYIREDVGGTYTSQQNLELCTMT